MVDGGFGEGAGRMLGGKWMNELMNGWSAMPENCATGSIHRHWIVAYSSKPVVPCNTMQALLEILTSV